MSLEISFDKERAVYLAPAIRILTGGGIVKFVPGSDKADFVVASYDDIEEQYSALESVIKDYIATSGNTPKAVAVENLGVFCCAATKAEADEIACAVAGTTYSPADEPAGYKRIAEKIAIVTGSAQGFGLGIAEEMLKAGGNIVIADLNYDLASSVCENLKKTYGNHVFAAKVDVTDEESTKDMVFETVLEFGGLDVFVNNAGIAKAGNLEEMTLQTLEFTTKVNYFAYFLGTKYASRIMKIQHRFNKDYYADIIQVNSKSGLSGSNKNFAYAGSKFGGIGLTQSFALELVEYNIKVNSVCPGNYLDGPLWSDPEKGLFVQYLRAGKVPGAKTIADVKEFYESKVPMHKGCYPVDVARAIFYCMEQTYETGQAIPVTGGQNMLK